MILIEVLEINNRVCALSNDDLHGDRISNDEVKGAEEFRERPSNVQSNGRGLDDQVPHYGQVADGRDQLDQVRSDILQSQAEAKNKLVARGQLWQ